MKYVAFERAIKDLGFDPKNLELEYFLAGANNYVIGLKYHRTTWAVSISFPKTRHITKDKLEKFIRLKNICSYLTEKFKEGIEIDKNTKFIFDGNCFLCEQKSTKEFIKNLTEKQDFKISNEIYNYQGPFLTKKGAPASETLEYDIDFKTIMLQSLAVLHKHTGAVKLIDKNLAIKITKDVIDELDKKSKTLKKPKGFLKVIKKYNEKWNKEGNKEVENHIIREVLIRSDGSFKEIVKNFIKRHGIGLLAHRCFIHGDAHGGNFIIVQKGEKKEVHPIDVEEALGLNENERQPYLFDLIKFVISAYNLSRIFKKPLKVEELIDIYYNHFDLIKMS